MNHDLTRPVTLNKVQQTIVLLPRGKPLKGTNSQWNSSKTLHLSWHPHSLKLSKVFKNKATCPETFATEK